MRPLCFVWLVIVNFLALAAMSRLFENHHQLVPYVVCVVIGLTTGLAVRHIVEE